MSPGKQPEPIPRQHRCLPVVSFALLGLSVGIYGIAFWRFSNAWLQLALACWLGSFLTAIAALVVIRFSDGSLRDRGLAVASLALAPSALFSGCSMGPVPPGWLGSQCRERCARIALAMYAYADANNRRFPPAALRDKQGRPLLSWRVLLLPYLEQQELFDRFRLDESWDSPHNLALLPLMPDVYRLPGRADAENTTPWQVLVGPGTPFEIAQGPRVPDDFPDGTATTIIIAEAYDAVPWTQPADLVYSPKGPLPRFGPGKAYRWPGHFSRRPKSFVIALGDGSVRDIHMGSTSEATLRTAITRNDGQPLGPDW